MIKAVAKISGDDYNVVVKTYSFVRFSFLCRSKNPEKLMFFEVFKEAQTGFEPVDTGVADHCLTTWLLRLTQIVYLDLFYASTMILFQIFTRP